jgi:hypothetical protein
MSRDRDASVDDPPALPGACVAVPQVKNEVRSRDGAMHWEVETHFVAGLDLDGHGSPVVLVPPADDELTPDGMYWTLYLMRGECGHELGIVEGLEDPTLEAGESHGLRNISTLRPSSSAPSDRPLGNLVQTLYTFDGNQYQAGKNRQR